MQYRSRGPRAVALLALPLAAMALSCAPATRRPKSSSQDGDATVPSHAPDAGDSHSHHAPPNGGPGGSPDIGSGGPPAEVEPAAVGVRRLTRTEYALTLKALVGYEAGGALSLLPEDPIDPFDNDYTLQQPSQQLIEALELVAEEAAAAAVNDSDWWDANLPCTPGGPGDEACLRAFIESFGRRAIRRPLTEAEVEALATLQQFATEDNDAVDNGFHTAVELVVRALLQHAELVYRVERGTPVPGAPELLALNDFEIASRLSYLLWGGPPDDALLDLAAAGGLADPAQRVAVAAELLDDPRARTQVSRFHSQWLGYHQLPHPPELTARFQVETDALIERVIFGDQSYWELFLSEETYVDEVLADHYDLPEPEAGEGWVAYGDQPRRGILSHGAVLAAFSKFGDTSPTQRGLFIRSRLMCQTISPPPPNLMVNVDMSPQEENPDACKEEAYVEHAVNPACKGCHQLMDPIGFGLENYDIAGRWREHDDGRPECTITGQGSLSGVGTFSGADELAELLAGTGELEQCIVQQVFRFAYGRDARVEDLGLLDALSAGFADSGHTFKGLLLSIVAEPTFALRAVDNGAEPEAQYR